MLFKEMNLSEELLKAVTLLQYEEALPVQEKVIPVLMDGRDVLVQSKTGSGKTASYAIPEIEKIDWLENEPQVLVLTPTRELAKQVQTDFKSLGAYKRINAITLFGKQPFKSQIMDLKQKVHVVVGTAGRVLDHLERGSLNLSHVHTCVLDEADEMLNLGFIDEVTKILSYLPDRCTMAMFSATINDSIKGIAEQYLHEPEVIKIGELKKYNTNVDLYCVKTVKEKKDEQLLNIIYKEVPQQAIVFCNFRESVERVFDLLCSKRVSCLMIHGGLMQEERLENMRDFKKGKYRILVATDVAGRGIDVTNVTHVINYEFPTTTEDFIHRIGRCGRVDKKGRAISMVLPTQMKYLDFIQEELDTELVCIDESEYEGVKYSSILSRSEEIRQKEEVIDDDKFKLFFKGGRNKKLRAKDLVGAIMDIPGVEFNDIGIIEILESTSFVEILNGKGELVLKGMQGKNIKNKNIVVEKKR